MTPAETRAITRWQATVWALRFDATIRVICKLRDVTYAQAICILCDSYEYDLALAVEAETACPVTGRLYPAGVN